MFNRPIYGAFVGFVEHLSHTSAEKQSVTKFESMLVVNLAKSKAAA
jgi:hypothetical protein